MSTSAIPSQKQLTESSWKTMVGAVLLALLIRIVIFEAFEIDGPSMEPSLLNGDRVVVSKFSYGLFLPFTNEAIFTWGMPNPGDVVIVRSPYDNIDIVKRVIGVAGDTVEVRDDMVYRNGVLLFRSNEGECLFQALEEDPECEVIQEGIDERDWLTSHAVGSFPSNMAAMRVPEGHIFVMGDHRDRSNDSRNPRVGMIPINRVKGRALATYWSSDGAIRWDRVFESVR